MSYQSVVEMAGNYALLERVAAAAAEQGVTDAMRWAQDHIWRVVASAGWGDAWDYAEATKNDDVNPDTGRRPGVISDGMILAAVQPLIQAEQTPDA